MFKRRQNTLAIKSSQAAFSLSNWGEGAKKNLTSMGFWYIPLSCTPGINISDLKLAFFHTGWQATQLKEALIKSFLAKTLELRRVFYRCVSPTAPPPSFRPYPRVSFSRKGGKRVNPSATFTPKVCSTIGYHKRKPVELGRTEVPVQTRLTTSFESQLLAFFSQIPSLSRTEGEITQQNVIPRFSFPRDLHLPTCSPAK